MGTVEEQAVRGNSKYPLIVAYVSKPLKDSQNKRKSSSPVSMNIIEI